MMRGGDDTMNYDARHAAKIKKGGAWPVYKRLLGYVLHYKLLLVVALLCAVFVAGSLVGILLGARAFVDIVLEDDPVDAAENRTAIHGYIAEKRDSIPWLVPLWLDDRVDAALDHLRGREEDPEGVRTARKKQALWWLAGGVVMAMAFAGLARFFQEYCAASIATRIGVQLGQEMYANIIRLPLRFFEQHTTGEIIARLTNDIFMAGRGLSQVFMKLLREPIKAVFCFGLALSIDPGLTLIGLAVLPPAALVIIKIGQSVRKRMRRSLEKVALLQSVAKESITGITIIKGFCMEAFDVARMNREYLKLRRQGLKMMKADAAVGPLTEIIMVCGAAAFIVLSGQKVLNNDLELSDLGTLYVALGVMLDTVRKLSAVNNAVQSSVASATRAFEFIDLKPDIVEVPGAVELAPVKESLRFENVHYSYDGKTPVLDGVSFTINKGEMVAIVGFSGAGKSTLAKLVPRFYDVTDGSISIDGTDIRQATLASLRRQISIVTQETILFNESVRMNIAAGDVRYTEERVRQAAKAAHADGFIEPLRQGYDTNIGEAGGTLSGGQRQRLAIARALVKDPAILILDEATSSLDSESEQAIQQAIEEFIVGRTTIVIAHRLSTVQRADRILVLDEGKILEQGSHDELLQKEGSLYRRLYEVQFAPADKAPEEG
jgi:ATP-binding cassette, subfamily B, bacterial MsbA